MNEYVLLFLLSSVAFILDMATTAIGIGIGYVEMNKTFNPIIGLPILYLILFSMYKIVGSNDNEKLKWLPRGICFFMYLAPMYNLLLFGGIL